MRCRVTTDPKFRRFNSRTSVSTSSSTRTEPRYGRSRGLYLDSPLRSAISLRGEVVLSDREICDSYSSDVRNPTVTCEFCPRRLSDRDPCLVQFKGHRPSRSFVVVTTQCNCPKWELHYTTLLLPRNGGTRRRVSGY